MKFHPFLSSLALLGLVTGAVLAAGAPALSPAVPRFSQPLKITHPYLPLAALKQDVLEGKEGKKTHRVERTVRPDLHKTFRIGDQDVEALVVEDRDYENGKLVEATRDYFAQSDDGTVYYLGEDVDEYTGNKITGHAGAWLYGKHTTVLGVLLPAHPKVGDKFRSEDVPNITREDDEVVSTTETVVTPAGTYRDCVEVKEILSDGVVEYKFYAQGIGCVKEVLEDGNITLVSHTIRAAGQ